MSDHVLPLAGRSLSVRWADGLAHLARPAPGTSEALVAELSRHGTGVTVSGDLRWTAYDAPAVAGERPVAVDQTNASVVVGEQLVVKWVTEPTGGTHPAADRLRALAEAGFGDTPTLRGILEWRVHADQGWVPLAFVTDLVPEAEDGWTWCVQEVVRAARGAPFPDLFADLGRVTARMHLALAGGCPPVPADAAYARRLADLASESLRAARSESGSEAVALLARRRVADDATVAALARCTGTPLTWVHGDFHVGQVIRDPAGAWGVLDFDGNPVLPPADRAAAQPPAMDVAGMLLALENVGHVVLRRRPEAPPGQVWRTVGRAQADFLGAYRSCLDAAGASSLLDDRLVQPLMTVQVWRELMYAARHLPRWEYVPVGVMRRRLCRPATDDGGT